jgi:hypothetical protein
LEPLKITLQINKTKKKKYMHAEIHACRNTCMQKYMHAEIHACRNTCMQKYMHAATPHPYFPNIEF